MGLGGWFKKAIVCPECRSRWAVKGALGRVRCLNRACRHYDPSVRNEEMDFSQRQAAPGVTHQGSFDPGGDRILIRYRNFRGEDVEVIGDRRTIRFRRAHLSVCVAPTGRRIALWQRFIGNLDEVRHSLPRGDPSGQSEPTAVERQILGYHRKHGTTSPRYDALRRKYPHWTR